MSPNNSKEEYRFYINKNENAKEEDIYKNYILEQNNVLHNENIHFRKEIEALNAKIEELEDQEDFNTKRSSNLKGLLKNFHEIDKLRCERIKINDIDDLNAVKYIQEFKTHKLFLEISSIFLFVLFLFIFDFLTALTVSAIGVVNIAHNQTLFKKLLLLRKNNRNTTQIDNKITEIVKAQDYIHEFLDSQ